ncbi:hypothetical protein C1645_811896 [Glomus cerebriforme]|uniref:Uncharacterized protein n=1 Tax=Glomus cerebriforme TaxID=658196 RepID=A0A397TLL7_9GLOM|nr:hypothetical protein C1645_811896 [Glomus cerebriforme]
MATYLQKAGEYCFQKMAEPKKNDYDSTVYVKIENPEGIEYRENHLIIINNKLEKCLGESIRDAIDDEFHHLYFDLKEGVEVSDYRIKNNLIKVLEKGNIKYCELQTMSLYKQHQNKVAHKEKWKPENKNKGQRKEATKDALECIKIATKIRNNLELISTFKKCIKDLYI